MTIQGLADGPTVVHGNFWHLESIMLPPRRIVLILKTCIKHTFRVQVLILALTSEGSVVISSSLLRLLAALALDASSLCLSHSCRSDRICGGTRRSQFIALIARSVLQIHIANCLYAAREPLLEWLSDKVSVCRKPSCERNPDLSGAWRR